MFLLKLKRITGLSWINPVAMLQLFSKLQLHCRKVQSLPKKDLCPVGVIEETWPSYVAEFGPSARMNLQTAVRSLILRNTRDLNF